MPASDVPRVFISYTGQDLASHAQVVREVLQQREWIAVDHKLWPSHGRPSVEWCVERVRECDLLVVLVAHRYGWVPPETEGGDGERSIVRIEVEAARERSIHVLPFLVATGTSWPTSQMEVLSDTAVLPHLDAFKEELSRTGCAFFREAPESLRALLHPAFEQIARKLRQRDGGPAVPAGRSGDSTGGPGGPGATTATGDAATLLDTYRTWLRGRFGEVRLLGFGEQFDPTLTIDSLYVPLRAMTARSLANGPALGKHDPDRLAEAEYLEQDVLVTDAVRRAGDLGLQGAALIGDPGAGKTTAARRLCWEAATDAGASALGLPEGAIPVPIRLRRLQAGDERRSLQAFVTSEIASWCGPEERQLDAPGLELAEALWNHPSVFWLFDGLDEVSHSDARAKVSGWIRAHRSRHADHRYVVTCRYAGYQDDARLGGNFLDMHVQPLSREQQDEFVRRWFDAVECAVGGRSPKAEAVAKERGDALAATLGSPRFVNQRLASIAANPLMLSVLCLVHRKGNELPRRRSLLYEQCVTVLLEHWRHEWRTAQDVEPIDAVTARALLEPMAWWLHQEQGRTDADGDQLVKALQDTLDTLADRPDLSERGIPFLERIRDDAGLLVTPDPGRFGFLHLTFQEYLAAQHAVSQGYARELAQRLGDEWWKEVTLLALGQAPAPFAERFFDSVLARKALKDLDEPLADVLGETLHLPLPLLVERIEKGPLADRLVLLRLLMGSKDDRLLKLARKLVDAPSEKVAVLAEQILVRAGETPPPRMRVRRRQGELPSYIHRPSGIVLVSIPAGSFRMGGQAHDDEQPIHDVSVPAFQLAKYPVTNEQYGRFLEARGHRAPDFWTQSRFNQPNQPVVGVSWEDAGAFCQWAGMRLPTEAEWEYSCRAGTTSDFSFGDDERKLPEHAWFDEDWGSGNPHPVGEKRPNPWGLHDVHGNVWEWCEDTWHDSYEGAPNDGSPWVDEGSAARVLRGGSWYGLAWFCRSACRYGWLAGVRSRIVGFRPARSLT